MAEAACGSNHEEQDRRYAANMLGYDAFQHRIERFREHVIRVASEEVPVEDDLIYSNEELIAAYEEAEQAGEAAIAAYIEFKRTLRVVNLIRRSIDATAESRNEKHRNIGSGVLSLPVSEQ